MLGVGLVLASALAGGWLLTTARGSTDYWLIRDDVRAGARIEPGDLELLLAQLDEVERDTSIHVLVLSAEGLGMLGSICQTAVGSEHPSLTEWLRAVRVRHLRQMIDLLRPDGLGIVFNVLVSSRQMPSLAKVPDEAFEGILTEVLERQRLARPIAIAATFPTGTNALYPGVPTRIRLEADALRPDLQKWVPHAWVAGDHHALESWNDFEPVRGLHQLTQPAIRPLYKTRQGLQSLLKWAGDAAGGKDYREYLKTFWENNLLAGMAYGWLFWRRSLETAMLAHATTHIGLALGRWIM